MAMYNKFITFLVLTFIVSFSYAQQYTPMTAAGYQYKRAKVDSTLHIPSFCGVPNLRNSTAIQGALAMDTCANKLYQWTHAAGWSTITTNAIDSLKRSSDSIFARKSGVWVFQYKDSIGGGGNPTFQDVIDNGNLITKNDTIKLNEQTRLNFTGKASSTQTYPLLDIYNGNTGGIITMQQFSNPLQQIIFSPNYTYIRNDDISIHTTTGLNITNGDVFLNNDNKINFLNTSGGYYNSLISDANNDAADKIHHLPNLFEIYDDTLATTLDIRNSTIDTSNKWVNNIYRTLGVDSIYYKIGSTTYAIKDSAGGQNGRFGNDTATIVMAKVHNDAGVILTNGKVVSFSTSGTNSNAPSVRLANNKADSTSANTLGFVSGTIAVNDTGWVILSGHIEKLNTSAFSNGDIIYLDSISGQWTKSKPKAPYHMVYLGVIVKSNAGNGSIFVKCQNGYELDEIHDVQINSPTNNQILVYSDTQKLWKNRNIYSVVDTTNKIATKTDLALKLNISDTSTMLSKYLRKTDTASLSNRIDLRVKYTDTATMLTPYLRKTDTASLSSRINLKVNISDTATMLSPYLRTNTASATYLAKSDSTIYYTKYRSDTSRTNIYNALLGKQGTLTLTTTGTSGASTLVGNTLNIPQYSGGTSYTFSTGLTNSSGTVTSNLSTGVSGGQSVVGGTAASENLTLSSTSNATKGKLLFGTSAYDEVNNRLGIGTASPTTNFQLSYSNNAYGQGAIIQNTNTGTTAITGLLLRNSSAVDVAQFSYYPSNYIVAAQANSVSFGSVGQQKLSFGANTSANGAAAQDIIFSTLGTNSTYQMQIKGNGNIQINTNTDAGYRFDVNGTARVQGALNFNPTNTASGTTGNQTINKASGTVNIAAAGTTVTVTNSLVTTSSIVFAVIRTNDATATIKNVVPAAGSFTINLGSATTAETSIGFFVIN